MLQIESSSFHVNYALVSSKFLVKKYWSFIIKKTPLCMFVYFFKLSISVTDPQFYIKFQNFGSNHEVRVGKLHSEHITYHQKFALHFWNIMQFFTCHILPQQALVDQNKLNCKKPLARHSRYSMIQILASGAI